MTDFNPSNCEIIKAVIITHAKDKSSDINAIIGKINFSQSIASSSWSGSAVIYDTTGFLESFPLRGEEQLNLKLKSNDLNYEVNLKTQIYKIDNVSTMPNNGGVVYTIHFVSKASYESGKRSITKSYKDLTASTIAKEIFKEYYTKYSPSNDKESLPYDTIKYNISGDNNKGRRLYVQPTNGYLRVVVPSYVTSKAMKFIATKSYSVNAPSSSYRFFETFDSYFFVTDEFLIKSAINNKKVINLFYDTFISLDPKMALDQIRTIETFSNPDRVNVGSDISNGGYRNTIMEIDYVRRKINENQFDFTKDAKYIDTTGNQSKISSDIHTKQFIDDTFNEENAKTAIIFKDYSQEGDIPSNLRADQYYSEIISRRISQQHHMNSISIDIGLKGRLDITAGNIINIKASKFSGSSDKERNQQLSGNYLVHTINHDIDKGVLTTSAKLIKYDWSTD